MTSVDRDRFADATPTLFELAEHIVRQALFADPREHDHLDWDLVIKAYDALISLAERAAEDEPSPRRNEELLLSAYTALDMAMNGPTATLRDKDIAFMNDVRGRLREASA